MYFQTFTTVLPLLMLASGAVSTDCESQSSSPYADKAVHYIDLDTAEKYDPIESPTKIKIAGCLQCEGIEADTTGKSYLPRQAPLTSDTLTTDGSDESTYSSSYSPVVVTDTSIETVTSPNIVFVTSPASVAGGPNIGPLTYPTSTTASPFPSKETSTSSRVETSSSESASAQTTTASNAAGALTRSLTAVAGIAGVALGAVALF